MVLEERYDAARGMASIEAFEEKCDESGRGDFVGESAKEIVTVRGEGEVRQMRKYDGSTRIL